MPNNMEASPRVGMKNEVPMSEPKLKTANGSVYRAISVGLYSTHDSGFDSMVYGQGESGRFGGVFNYTNTIIGSGIVGMPYACK